MAKVGKKGRGVLIRGPGGNWEQEMILETELGIEKSASSLMTSQYLHKKCLIFVPHYTIDADFSMPKPDTMIPVYLFDKQTIEIK